MKAFALVKMAAGQPDWPPALVTAGEVVNYVLADRIPGTAWGAYLVSARPAVLYALATEATSFVPIVAVTEEGTARWAELDTLCPGSARDTINAYLSARGLATIPDGWTNRRVVRELFARANARFDLDAFDVADTGA